MIVDEKPLLFSGQYYLADSGFPIMSGFLTPYRGERYHLPRFRSGDLPQGPRELFNFRHSSLRMTIERCFGLLKCRFRILKSIPCYKLSRQPRIVIACCALHNWIKVMDPSDDLFNLPTHLLLEDDHGDDEVEAESSDKDERSDTVENLSTLGAQAMAAFKDNIAQAMWDNIH